MPVAHVLGGEGPGGAAGIEVDRITAEHAHERRARGVERGGGAGVVDLVRGRDARDRERGRGDVGRRRRLGQRVIAGLGAADGQTGHGHRDAGPHVLGGEGPGGTAGIEVDRIAAEHAHQRCARRVERGGGAGVINLVRGGDARDRERGRSDVGRRRRLGERVIAGLGAADRQTGHRHRDAGAHVLGGEGPGRAVGIEVDRIAAEHAHQRRVRGVEGGRGAGVVYLVRGRDARDRERGRGDVGRRRRLGERVIAGLGAR